MKKIATYHQACKVLKLKQTNLPKVSGLPARHRKAIIAHFKLVIIIEALNDGWKPDWNNFSEYKYWPYFDMRAGFGFSGTHCDYWYTRTSVGSRLCFKNRELAEYAAKKFKSLYKDYFTYNN